MRRKDSAEPDPSRLVLPAKQVGRVHGIGSGPDSDRISISRPFAGKWGPNPARLLTRFQSLSIPGMSSFFLAPRALLTATAQKGDAPAQSLRISLASRLIRARLPGNRLSDFGYRPFHRLFSSYPTGCGPSQDAAEPAPADSVQIILEASTGS